MPEMPATKARVLLACREVCTTQTGTQRLCLHGANDCRSSSRYNRSVGHSRPTRYTNWYLRDWMRVLHVRQRDIVERTDLTKTAVSLLCSDRQDYTPAIIRDVSAALNIAPFELLMHPEDAMNLRQLRKDAIRVVATSKAFEEERPAERSGTGG